MVGGSVMRPTREQWAMAMAVETAKRATCLRRQVGCVLLNERGHVLSTGYNGRPAGMPHCNEETKYVVNAGPKSGICYDYACAGASSPSGTNLDACEAVHAEQNALLQCRDVYAIDACYATTAPCITCIKLLMNTSCLHIYFLDDYPHAKAAEELWLRNRPDRTWVKMPCSA